MAEDRMRNDDSDMNLGGAGQQKDDFGKQTPGRKSQQQDDLSTGQRTGGQQQNEPEHFEDNFGTSGKSGGQGGQGGFGQGGQNL